MAKRYSPKLKFQVVLELLQGDKTPGQIAKVYGVHPNSVSTWKRTLLEKGPEIFAQDSTVAEYERRIAKLERLLGQKEVQIALLKNFLGQTR
jgi:transposase-like protein